MTPIKTLVHLLGALLLCACSPAQSEQFNLPGMALVIPDRYIDHDTMSQPDVPGFDPVRSTIWLQIPGNELRALIPEADRKALEEDMLLHEDFEQAFRELIPQNDLKAFDASMVKRGQMPSYSDYREFVTRLPVKKRTLIENEIARHGHLIFQVTPIGDVGLNGLLNNEGGGYQQSGVTSDGLRRFDGGRLQPRQYLDGSGRLALMCFEKGSKTLPASCHRYLVHEAVVINYSLEGEHADDAHARVAVDRTLQGLVDSWRKP